MKKIGSKKLLFLIIFGGLLTAYFLWWNRGSSLPEVDDALLNLPITAPVPKEENLGYTLQGSGFEEITSIIKTHLNQPMIEHKLRKHQERSGTGKYCEDLFCLLNLAEARESLLRLPETRENKPIGKSKVLLSSGIALSFSAYLELFDIAQLYQKLSATEFFSELIRAIQDQERTIDEYIYRLDENCHPAVCLPPDLQELVHTMNAFTIYLTRMHEYDQAFEYWKSGYLLGQKIANNSLSHSAVVGNYLQRFGLNTLYLLHQHFDLPVSIQNKYADFLAKNPIQGQTRYQRILLNQYHATKNTLLKLYQAEDIIIANHKIEFPFLYLWNKEKSLKAALMITKAYFRYLLFEHKTNEEAYQQIYQNVIGNGEKSIMGNLFVWVTFIPSALGVHEEKILFFWNKYILERIIIAPLLSLTSIWHQEDSVSLEKYQKYLLHLLNSTTPS